MTAFLKAADLTQDRFLNLIANLCPDSDRSPCYIWLEAPDGWAFDRWDWQSDLKGTPHGGRTDCEPVETDSVSSDGNCVNMLHWCRAGCEPVEELAYNCLTRSTAGRLFAPTGELRWRTIPALGKSCWRTVFLGNVDWVGTVLDDHSGSLHDLHPERDSFFLWGQQTGTTPDEWIELRIPHRFHYPVSGNPNRVKVVVEQWYDNTGEPHFVRLCGLESH